LSADRFDLTIIRAIKALVYFKGGSFEIAREDLNATDELKLRLERSHDGEKYLILIEHRNEQGGQDESGQDK